MAIVDTSKFMDAKEAIGDICVMSNNQEIVLQQRRYNWHSFVGVGTSKDARDLIAALQVAVARLWPDEERGE